MDNYDYMDNDNDDYYNDEYIRTILVALQTIGFFNGFLFNKMSEYTKIIDLEFTFEIQTTLILIIILWSTFMVMLNIKLYKIFGKYIFHAIFTLPIVYGIQGIGMKGLLLLSVFSDLYVPYENENKNKNKIEQKCKK